MSRLSERQIAIVRQAVPGLVKSAHTPELMPPSLALLIDRATVAAARQVEAMQRFTEYSANPA